MDGLPQGWVSIELGNHVYIAGRIGWRGLKRSEYTTTGPLFLAVKNILPNGEVDFNDTEHISKDRYNESPEIKLQQRDILLTKDGSIGKVGMVKSLPADVTVNSSILVVRPQDNILEARYLFHYLRGPQFQQIARDRITGSAVPHLFQKDIKKLNALVPPINEQRRIVTKLDQLLAKVDAIQKRLDKIPGILKHFRQSVLAAACSGRLTEDWRNQNNIPDSYENTIIEKLVNYRGGFAYKSSSFVKTGKYQVVRIGNVKPFRLDLSASPVFISKDFAENTERFRLRANDIVISMTGTKYKKDYGYASLVSDGSKSLYLNQRISRIRCNDKVLPEFLLYWLQTNLFRVFFFEGETGNVNQGNVGADGIRNAPIELPSINEQQEIIRRVDELFKVADQIEERYNKANAHIDKITQSILAKAFRGELVPQDPNDEPASELLKRIREERAKDQNQAKQKRTRKRSRVQS